MEKIDIIKLRVGMSDPKGFLLPRGVKETMTAEIADEVATFWFVNGANTKHFADIVISLEKRRGAEDTVYLQRFQKIVTKYPNMKKEEIRDLILSQLKQMGINAKERG